MLKIIDAKTKTEFYIPTSMKDITKDNIERLVHNFNVSPNFSIVCLAQKISIADFSFAAVSKNFKKNTDIRVTTLYAKGDANCEIGDVLTVDSSVIERGHHLGINSGANIDYITTLLINNENVRKDLIEKKLKDSEGNIPTHFIALAFKIIPTTTITCSLSPNAVLDDPYKVITQKTSGK